MVVGIQTLYPVPLKENGHVLSYKNFCPEYKVPKKTVENEVASLVANLEATPGFNPNLKFDPKTHIIFSEGDYKKTKKFTLNDLQIEKTHLEPLNNFGAVFPFKLLSQEAVNMLLWEALQPQIIENYARIPNHATGNTRLDFHIGGHFKYAPFTESLVKSKEISQIVSTFVGHKLRPVWDSDLLQINVSLASDDLEEQMKYYPQTQEAIDRELARQDASDGNDIPSTVGVHYDSISVPLVIMLDLPKEAQGGQTTIITGNNKATRVPDPPAGSGTLIQGRVMRHLASKPVTNHNRISFVVSFATGVEGELDNCVMTTVKPSVLPKNEYNKFYNDWIDYKFTKMETHLRMLKEEVKRNYEAGVEFDQETFVRKCMKAEDYFHNIYAEMECVENKPYPPAHFNIPYADL